LPIMEAPAQGGRARALTPKRVRKIQEEKPLFLPMSLSTHPSSPAVSPTCRPLPRKRSLGLLDAGETGKDASYRDRR